jgi:hypothetical protein
MKKIILLISILSVLTIKAQYFVQIPDANFLNYLQSKFPGAVNGNSLHVTDSRVISCQTLSVKGKGISDLTGIQYFTSLTDLNCAINSLTVMATLPNSLISLDCSYNSLVSIPSLPVLLEGLICDHNQLNTLPTLPNTLEYLFCNDNKITCFPYFPSSLKNMQRMNNWNYYYIDLSHNSFACLPNYLPSVMQPTLMNYPICTTATSLCEAAVGVMELSVNNIDIRLSPNPNSGSFKLDVRTEIQSAELILINLIGQDVYHLKLSNGQNDIDVLDLKKGLYNYFVVQNNIQLAQGKVAIE